eukprot:SAG31_NODE_2863_length_4982_cov_2.545361_4_plen_244_part_00
MPPEVLRRAVIIGHTVQSHSGGHSPRSDLWAAGICLFSMLAGRPPFEGKDVDSTYARIKSGKFCWPTARMRQPSPEVDDLVGLLLKQDPADRPPAALLLAGHPFLDPVARPLSLPLSTTTMCPKFDKFGRIDAEASTAAAKGCRSSGSAYGVPLKLAKPTKNRALPRQCVLGPEVRADDGECGGAAGALRHLNIRRQASEAGARNPSRSPLWTNIGMQRASPTHVGGMNSRRNAMGRRAQRPQ